MKYPVFNYDLNKVKGYAEQLQTLEDELDYLEYVLKEYKNQYYSGDETLELLERLSSKSFIVMLEREIEYREKALKRGKSNRRSLPSYQPTNSNPLRQGEKIRWAGKETELIYLFELLFNEGLLPMSLYDKRFSLIESHFLNSQGQPFKRKQLSQASLNISINRTSKPKKAETLERVVRESKDK